MRWVTLPQMESNALELTTRSSGGARDLITRKGIKVGCCTSIGSFTVLLCSYSIPQTRVWTCGHTGIKRVVPGSPAGTFSSRARERRFRSRPSTLSHLKIAHHERIFTPRHAVSITSSRGQIRRRTQDEVGLLVFSRFHHASAKRRRRRRPGTCDRQDVPSVPAAAQELVPDS
jgi:hypothetical protein